MIEENNEVVEEINDNEEQPIEEAIEQTIDESKFDSADDPDVVKVDLDNLPNFESQVEETTEQVEEVKENNEEPVVEEVTDEAAVQEVEEAVEEAIEESIETGNPLPENIQKLVDFMDETGGDIQDYVRLNRDLSNMDDSDVLDEYYRDTKPHLSAEERNFLLEDKFNVDEDIDDERTARKKKIALKEQVAEARAHLDRQKSKYYQDIKAGSRLTQEQQEAINFYNRYQEESEQQQKLSEASTQSFLNKTEKLFNDKFKGFEYNVGDKKYRFNVKDVNKVKTTQSDINNFLDKFVGEDNMISDAEGYHKSLFTAMNADTIAKHFYEQGKADAIKDRVARDKNINLEPRKTHGETNVGGVKFKVLGESAADMKNRSFKIRKRK
mgnify:CR=1 FL=1